MKAEDESAGKTVARNRGLHRKGNYGQLGLLYRVSLGNFLPANLSLAGKRRKRAGHRRSRREEASERTLLAFKEWGQLGTVTEHVPCEFRSTLRQRDERPLVVRIADRMGFDGLSGVV